MKAAPSQSVLGNLGYLGGARVATLCMGFVTTSHLAHVLGTENFGITNFSIAYISYFMIVVGLGYDTFLTREIAHDQTQLVRLVNSMISVRLTLALGMILVLYVSLPFLDLSTIGRSVVLIQGFLLFTSAIGLTPVYQGLQRMRVVAYREFFANLLSMVGILVLVRAPEDVIAAAYISIVVPLVTNGLLLSHYVQEFRFPRIRFPGRRELQYARASLTLFWSMLMVTLNFNMHILLLGLMRTQTEVGLFSASWKLFNFAIVLPSLISALFMPRIANQTDMPHERRESAQIYMQTILMCAIPITVFGEALAPQIITVLFGAAYLPALPSVALLLLNALVVSLNIGFGTPLIAVGRQQLFLRIMTVGAVLGLVSNLILIPRFGIIGAAAGTLIDEMSILVMLVANRPEGSLPHAGDAGLRCLLAAIPAGIIAHLAPMLPLAAGSNLAGLLIGGAAGGTTYLLALSLLRIHILDFAATLRGLK
jgi:O-antigen/teichoic acid export membrane protein